jgi:hypothetical protein
MVKMVQLILAAERVPAAMLVLVMAVLAVQVLLLLDT